MRPVQINRDGHLLKKEVAYFGGAYSFWEKLTRGGIGSAKVLYENGIPEFDQLDRGLANELRFVSFELLKNGLVLRLNQNQRITCVGTRFDKIEYIQLEAFRIEIKQRKFGQLKTKIVHRAEVAFHGMWEIPVQFSIISSQFPSLLAFFQRSPLKDKLAYSISTNPSEKDYGYLIDLLDIGW